MSQPDYPMSTVCPWCSHVHTSASQPFEGMQGVAPRDGDASMCIRCGEISVFDASHPDGLRKPTAEEQIEFENDYDVARLKQVWREAKDLLS